MVTARDVSFITVDNNDPATHTHNHNQLNASSGPLQKKNSGPAQFMISPSSSLIIPPNEYNDNSSKDEPRGFCAKFTCDCERFCSHCFFLFACLWFMLLTSMTRVVAILDIVLHVIIYVIAIAASFDDFFNAISNDFQKFNYARSCVDLLMLSLFRTIILYYLYAYKRQLDQQCVLLSFLIMALSSIYCFVKVCVVKTHLLRFVALFSLCYTIGEWVVYTALRRRRILVHMNEIYEDNEFDQKIDIESGGYLFIPTNTSLPPQSSSGNGGMSGDYQTYQSPRNNNNDISKSNDSTSIDGLGSTYNPHNGVVFADNNNDDAQSSTQQQIAQPVPALSRRTTVGPRRHKTTQNARIGGNSIQPAQISQPSPLPPSSPSTTQLPQHHTVYKPFLAHSAVQYSTQIPTDIEKLKTSQSQFIHFENIRVHYKFLVNPLFREYYDALADPEHLGGHDQLQLQQNVPPVLVIIHGFLTTTFNFEAFVHQHLFATADDNKYSAVLIFDRPGFGLSAMITNAQLDQRIANYNNQNRHQPGGSYPSYSTPTQQSFSVHGWNGSVESHVSALIEQQSAPIQTTDDADTSHVDYYVIVREMCNSPNPYHPHFVSRLITIFASIYRFQHHNIGFVLASHHSGGTISLAIALHFNLLFSTIRQMMIKKGLTNSNIKNPLLGLVLICCSVYDDGFPPLLQQLFSNKTVGKSMVTSLIQSECSTVAIKRAFFNPTLISPLLLILYKKMMKIQNKDEALFAMISSESSEYQQQYINWIKTNADLYITQPILMIHGENDKIIPISSTYKIIRTLLSQTASVQCVRINCCGHLPFHEAPETTASAMNSFSNGLAKLSSGTSEVSKMNW